MMAQTAFGPDSGLGRFLGQVKTGAGFSVHRIHQRPCPTPLMNEASGAHADSRSQAVDFGVANAAAKPSPSPGQPM